MRVRIRARFADSRNIKVKSDTEVNDSYGRQDNKRVPGLAVGSVFSDGMLGDQK